MLLPRSLYEEGAGPAGASQGSPPLLFCFSGPASGANQTSLRHGPFHHHHLSSGLTPAGRRWPGCGLREDLCLPDLGLPFTSTEIFSTHFKVAWFLFPSSGERKCSWIVVGSGAGPELRPWDLLLRLLHFLSQPWQGFLKKLLALQLPLQGLVCLSLFKFRSCSGLGQGRPSVLA